MLLLLGLGTLVLKDQPTVELNLTFSEFDDIIQAPVKQISAVELADYLMKQEHHYNLIDLQGDNASYRIPTAESYTPITFVQKQIPVNETIILYSQLETTATQLYYLLLIRGYFKVKVLTGGIEQWTQQILQPNIHRIPENQRSLRQQLTDFFGGSFSQTKADIKPKIINLEKKVKVHHGC